MDFGIVGLERDLTCFVLRVLYCWGAYPGAFVLLELILIVMV